MPGKKNTTKDHLPSIKLLIAKDWQDYELIDSGDGYKLERFGPYKLARPEPEAFWSTTLKDSVWNSADALFSVTDEKNGGHWDIKEKLPQRWPIQYKGIQFWVQITGSRQIGIFPEQSGQWDWISYQIRKNRRQLNILNLFGYTGMASLVAARAGARVTHLDASKKAIIWAKENQDLSNLSDKPIRWLVDDALKFVQRENRRGNMYDAIILDPPKFGRGPKGEVWEFYKLLPALLHSCRSVLSKNPQFVLLTAYAVKASALTLYNALSDMMGDTRGNLIPGEVIIKEKSAGRLISRSVYASWSSK